MLVLCGMPGCGKDTIFEILTTEYNMAPAIGSVFKGYNDNHIMICSPDGIEMLMRNPGAENIFIVQLLVPQDELRVRLADRPWSAEELERRLVSDEERYQRIRPLVTEYVVNHGPVTPYMSATAIFNEYEQWLQERRANQEKERE